MGLAGTLKGGVFSGIAALERLSSKRIVARKQLPGIKNFLLLQYPTALGTAIHATPLIPALRQAIPDCRIVVAASGFALDVFRNNPGVERLIATPSPLKDFKGAAAALRHETLFEGQSYATLTSTGNERTMIAMQSLLNGPAARIGFTIVPQIYVAPLEFDYSLSQIDNNLRMVTALGHKASHFEPQIFPAQEDLVYAKELLVGAGIQQGQFLAAFVTQTSVTQRKGWRVERFQAAAKFLHERYGAHILFVGTVAESKAIDELRSGLNFPTTSIAGKTNIPQVSAVLGLCNVGLTLDTGPMHIGRAAGLPMTIIAPAWSPPIEWLPLDNDRFHILKNLDMASAPVDYIIDEVSVEDVTASLDTLIRSYPRPLFTAD